MQARLRIPTHEYAYIEVDVEGTADEIVQQYWELKDLVNKDGLQKKEWIRVFDRYLSDGTMEAEEYESMSVRQKEMIQEIKRAFKRLKR